MSQISTQDTEVLQRQVNNLSRLHQMTAQMALLPETEQLIDALATNVHQLIQTQRVIVLVSDDADTSLSVGSISPPLNQVEPPVGPDVRFQISSDSGDPFIRAWAAGHTINATRDRLADSPMRSLLQASHIDHAVTLPLRVAQRLHAVIILQSSVEGFSPDDTHLLMLVTTSAAALLQNVRRHSQTVAQLAEHMREVNMLQQIDHELNETITLSRVFDMVLDWALRFTNASTATVALYDQQSDSIRVLRNYGWTISDDQLEDLRRNHTNTIAHRVARSGREMLVRDVAQDADRGWVADGIRSQFAVPVIRDDNVVAVITLESNKLDGFTPQHISFMSKLAARAAVAIDNARLHGETVREQDKLHTVLDSIADVVIVVDEQQHIILISQSALNALRLYSNVNYTGRPFVDVVNFGPLERAYIRAIADGDAIIDEVELPNGRNYFMKVIPMTGIGHAVVMQDITSFRETERLKSDLIATVSHDLKQPLSVMRGYIDLLQMKNTFDSGSMVFIEKLEASIMNMRQLIDDLLDLARIESGMDLELKPLSLRDMLIECVEHNRAIAEQKRMVYSSELPEDLPAVRGDYIRLQQVFNNLISNAIKYTAPEGEIRIFAERRDGAIRIGVQDNGMGISPEDQSHVFERFFRVRRPETDSIEGTGLGLAIVKKLVNAHSGHIDLQSKLGEGTTFFITLPAA